MVQLRLNLSSYQINFLCSYNVGCTKRMGLFPNRKTTLENMKRHRALNGSHKTSSLESKKKVTILTFFIYIYSIICKHEVYLHSLK